MGSNDHPINTNASTLPFHLRLGFPQRSLNNNNRDNNNNNNNINNNNNNGKNNKFWIVFLPIESQLFVNYKLSFNHCGDDLWLAV